MAGAQLAAPATEPATAVPAPLLPLDRATRIAYAAGEIPNAIKTILAALFGFFFYTSVMGLPGSLVGLGGAIGLAYDALIDPYIGHWSDKSRSRWGRRHVFMLAGALTMGLGFWASFSPPRGLSQGALFAWVLATGFLLRTATSLYRVPYFALGAELSRNYQERTSITGLRGIFGIVGGMTAAGLSFVLFFPNRGADDPKLRYEGYPALGLAFGAAMTVCALVATLGTRSRATRGDVVETSTRRSVHFLSASLQCLRNRSFGVLFISSSLFLLAVAMNSTLSIHFLTYYARVTDSKVLSASQGGLYLAGFLGIAFWLRVSPHLEKQRLYLVGTLATGLLMVAAFFLLGEGNLLGANNVPALLAGHALVGFFSSTLWFIPASLVADIADEDELATGERHEGSFFGLFSFGQQLATGLSMVLTGVLVDHFAGLVPGQAVQSAETVRRIGLLYSVFPGAMLFVAAACMLWYRLGRRQVAAIQRELDARHA